MTKKLSLVEALLDQVQPRPGDAFRPETLASLAETTTDVVDDWKAKGRPRGDRPIVAELVEALRACYRQVQEFHRSARPDAPRYQEAHDALLAAIDVLRAVRDEFPP